MRSGFASEVLPLFLELAVMPSPSGEERAVADLVTAYLRELGLDVNEDDAGARLGSSSGNLVTRLEPTSNGDGIPIFLCAHLDTVTPTAPIEPVVTEGVVRNTTGTILGADNKAAVATMLEAARLLLSERRPHAGVELLFTVREETGCEGAGAFDHSTLAAGVGFVFDIEGPIGDVILAAPHHRTIDVHFKGQAAHAGINPEAGRSAITAAARAICDLRLGCIDDETTANVGVIEGGVARNVVPDSCHFVAEARSRDERKLEVLVAEMLECIGFAAAVTDCEVETQVCQKYPGYRLRRDDQVVRLAAQALERSGHEVHTRESNGAADANVFNGRGLPCANLANGVSRIHSPEEEIAVADLEAMVDVTLELVEAARGA
jgi:tripeptide aminopeptidase